MILRVSHVEGYLASRYACVTEFTLEGEVHTNRTVPRLYSSAS